MLHLRIAGCRLHLFQSYPGTAVQRINLKSPPNTTLGFVYAPFEPERYDDTRPELTFRPPLYPTYLPNAAAVPQLTPRTCASFPGLGTTTFFLASHIHNHNPLAFLILAANLPCDNTSPQSATLSPGTVVVSSRYSIDPNPSSCALLCFAWAVEGSPTSTLALRPLLALCSVRRRRRL